MSQHLVLLGDSIFDNAAYVRGGPAVIDQVIEGLPPGWRATLNAVDGSVIRSVHRQLERLPDDASHLVLSAGGNDALGQSGVLRAGVNTVGEALLLLSGILDQFRRDYVLLLRAIADRGLPTAVCTIYHPRYPERQAQAIAATALCLFNDAIVRSACQLGLPVIDLRPICNTDADYANPIEPSSLGGAKIARAIHEAVLCPVTGKRRTVLFP